MQQHTADIVSIAEASLGGLRGRSALIIGPAAQRQPYKILLQQAGMKMVYQEESAHNLTLLLPQVQLLMSMPCSAHTGKMLLPAATIAQGCLGRRAPLVIFDLAETPSIEEEAGLLAPVCLYTPDDLRRILSRIVHRAVQIA